jgi:hypothetical protein
VGRLGAALNAMLGQIEAGYRAREASERKLRRFVADASHELERRSPRFARTRSSSTAAPQRGRTTWSAR